MLTLFKCSAQAVAASLEPPQLAMPRGTVRFELWVGSEETTHQPVEAWLLPAGAHAYVYAHQTYRAELLVLSVTNCLKARARRSIQTHDLPAWWPDKLDACWAALWRIEAVTPLPALQFTCRLERVSQPVNLDRSGGETFWGTEWADDEMAFATGSLDDDGLRQAALGGIALPRRLASLPLNFMDMLLELPQGQGFALPALEAGEHYYIEFATAWGPARTPDGLDNDGPILATMLYSGCLPQAFEAVGCEWP